MQEGGDLAATPFKTPYQFRLATTSATSLSIMTQPHEKSSPEEETFKTFERMISRQRLQRYRRATNSKQEAIALYLWNTALSESLYPALQFFEITLRNATHQALSAHRSNQPRWFMDMTLLTREHHQKQVLEALQKLRDQNKGQYLGNETDPNFPKEPHRVVAELSLGFWINLYSDPYTSSIVNRPLA